MTAPTAPCSVSLDLAREIFVDPNATETERAAANTIISLYQVIAIKDAEIEDYERTVARMSKAAGL